LVWSSFVETPTLNLGCIKRRRIEKFAFNVSDRRNGGGIDRLRRADATPKVRPCFTWGCSCVVF